MISGFQVFVLRGIRFRVPNRSSVAALFQVATVGRTKGEPVPRSSQMNDQKGFIPTSAAALSYRDFSTGRGNDII